MKNGFKRVFFQLKNFFLILSFFIVIALFSSWLFKGGIEVSANVATFYPVNCLGGWKNVDKVEGLPEVGVDSDVVYDDTNSASLFNTNAPVFCGGFTGEIPSSAKHQKVTLNFSWYIEDSSVPVNSTSEHVEDLNVQIMEKEGTAVDSMMSTSSELMMAEDLIDGGSLSVPSVEKERKEDDPKITTPQTSPASTSLESPSSEPEKPATVKETDEVREPIISLFKRFFTNFAYADEVPDYVMETQPSHELAEVISTTTEESNSVINLSENIATEDSLEPGPIEVEALENSVVENTKEFNVLTPPEGAYFAIHYTLDGQEWHSLGYVTRIANDVSVEMPINLFATVSDLEKVQISLHMIERFDPVPKIYLDALWLSVTYDDAEELSLIPPGQKPGDVLFSETVYQDTTAVVVLRNVALITLSNILSAANTIVATSTNIAATSAVDALVTDLIKSATTTVPEASLGLPVTGAGTTLSLSLTQVASSSILVDIINSTGVIVELWLFSSSTDSWSWIADDSIISSNPQVKFELGSVFWVDKNNAGVWRYDPKSGGYEALSLQPGELSKMQFRDEAGEVKELEFTVNADSVLLHDITALKL